MMDETVPIGSRTIVIPKELVGQVCESGEIPCTKVGDDMTAEQPIMVDRSYLRVVSTDGETIDATIKRVESITSKLEIPTGTHFFFSKIIEEGDDKKPVAVGLRTYVVRGDVAITEEDVSHATVRTDNAAAVDMRLTPEGAVKLEKFTSGQKMRRIAIVVNGNVQSAPAVPGAIAGGNLTIAFTQDEKPSDAQIAQANALVKALHLP